MAQLNLHHLRRLRLFSLRWVAAASFPLWVQAHWQVLPDLVVWGAFLAEGLCLSVATTFAVLEHPWSRRAAEAQSELTDAVVHQRWSVVDAMRSGIWYAFAILTLPPWVGVGFGWSLPAPLLSPLTLTACATIALLLADEGVARARHF